ncbi:MAG: hypothetical protein ACFB0G_00730 [Leptolyngbyaceae cyanobacterium]
MATLSSQISNSLYPLSDSEPMAEIFVHFDAMLTALEVLRQYLAGQRATVLSHQFLYYAQGVRSCESRPM